MLTTSDLVLRNMTEEKAIEVYVPDRTPLREWSPSDLGADP
jgi:hypothetical protein